MSICITCAIVPRPELHQLVWRSRSAEASIRSFAASYCLLASILL